MSLVFETPEERALYERALERFVAKCEYDELTGCVLWTGGTTSGKGNTARYGSFWFAGRRWSAHRWAASFIHNIDLSLGHQVGHCCPGTPNTLCVHHVEAQTIAENVTERNVRVAAQARAIQAAQEKQYWLLVEGGYAEPPEPPENGMAIPYPDPPEWFRAARERFQLDIAA